MAIKPTIYKFTISLSDLNHDFYDTLQLTVAQHPSENLSRMMARVLAYSLNAQSSLSFTKGLSEPDQPDIWARTLDDQIALWVDVGEPAVERIKKACRQATSVKVYSFNSKSAVWWQQNSKKMALLPVTVMQFDTAAMTDLAALVERTMKCSITITGNSAFVAAAKGECEVEWQILQDRAA